MEPPSFQLTNFPLTLTGVEEIEIQILQGGLAIDETIRTLIKTRLKVRLNDEEYLVRLFLGGQWLFQANGKFLFTPSPTANVDAELFPISGTYRQYDAHLEFNGLRQSVMGHVVSVDGCFAKVGDRWGVEFCTRSPPISNRLSEFPRSFRTPLARSLHSLRNSLSQLLSTSNFLDKWMGNPSKDYSAHSNCTPVIIPTIPILLCFD